MIKHFKHTHSCEHLCPLTPCSTTWKQRLTFSPLWKYRRHSHGIVSVYFSRNQIRQQSPRWPRRAIFSFKCGKFKKKKKLQSWFSMWQRDGWEGLLQWGWFMNEGISISNWKCVGKWNFKSINKQIRASFIFFMMVVLVVCSWAADAQRSWNVYGFVLKCLCAYIHTCWNPPSPNFFNNHSTH